MRFMLVGAALSAALIGAVVLAVPASASGLSGLHAQVQIGDRVCMKDHYHTGDSGAWAGEEQARAEAVRSWSSFTALEYGSQWGDWRLAADQTMNCTPTSSHRGIQFSCHVKALPCRPAHTHAAVPYTPQPHAHARAPADEPAPRYRARPVELPLPRLDLRGHDRHDRRHLVWPGDAR